MRAKSLAWAALLAGVAASAQGAPGFVELSFAGLGGQTTVSGESRLPVRRNEAVVDGGTLRIHALGARGSIREVTVVVPHAVVGQRADVDAETWMAFAFASGNSLSPTAGHGSVELTELDGDHAVGTFDATLAQGRIPLTIHGHFEVRLGH